MKTICSALLLSVAAVSAAQAADAPYLGKWRLNPSKSHLTNETYTFSRMPNGDYRFQQAGFGYTFRLDGKEYPRPDGGTTS